jgi:NMD protein affecting ribosome stability and mRNA decay
MFMTRFCPICGKTDAEKEFHGELCVECAKARVAALPTARVTICAKCGAVMDKGRKKKELSVQEEAARLLKLKGANPKFAPDMAWVEYDTPVGRLKQDAVVLITKAQCADCSRSHSQYFEAIIQLRGASARVQRMADALCRRIESRSFIPKMEELKEGIDIYCGSRNEAIAALNSQQLGFLRTEKLAGERNGKRLYRTTLLVRL